MTERKKFPSRQVFEAGTKTKVFQVPRIADQFFTHHEYTVRGAQGGSCSFVLALAAFEKQNKYVLFSRES